VIQEISSKSQAVELFGLGYFGNRVRQWNSLQELEADSFERLVVLRQRKRREGGRGIAIYDIEKKEAGNVLDSFVRQGHLIDSFYFNEAIIPANVVFQGEIMRVVGGLYLLYSTLAAHMHDALLKEPKHAFGLTVKILMEHYLDFAELDCIFGLLERFIDHVVEFTCCSKRFGDLEWRTIIWECRKF